MMQNKKKQYIGFNIFITPHNVFGFGKYKGLSFAHVLEINPNYIHWCMENISDIEISNYTFQYVIDYMRYKKWKGWDK